MNLDDRLRDLPGFSLFRRSSSLTAHPTTQGVSLRGIGPSGASRTLVLWDGVPVNDPFGGWVYWTRFAPEDVERVEVSRGASISVFGDRAMGGVIQLFSREPEPLRLHLDYNGGSHGSREISGGVSHLASRWAASAGLRAFATDGYFIVPASVRGTVDRRAGADFTNGVTRLDLLGAAHRFFLKLDVLAEQRANGTALQENSTGLGTLAARYSRERGSNGLSVTAFHTRETFRGSFSSIAPDRNSERLTTRQRVPSEAFGAGALWNHRGAGWKMLAGADVSRVEGYSQEQVFPAGSRIGGGSILQHGTFAQGDIGVGPLILFAGARHDFTGQGRQFFSPSAGLAAGTGRLRVRGSVYRAFRAPTLNELFREFRVGNAVTRANEALRPERLFGAEAGFDLALESLRLSTTFYRNSLQDLITNVTLSVAPNLILRQRQNAAAALARGVEVNALRRWGSWNGEAAYLFVDSRFSSGGRLPQVPRHQGSAQLAYERGGTLASAGFRSYAAQFEDERNQFLLPGYATLQLVVRRRLAAGFSVSAAVENLLDRQYVAGLTPTPLLGPPRLWRLGLRWDSR